MNRISPERYPDMVRYPDTAAGGAVYPLSMCEGMQHGDVYTFHNAALFWHDCGFAFLYGVCDEQDLEEIYQRFFCRNDLPRRFVLFAFRTETERFFREKGHLDFGKRSFFAYPQRTVRLPAAPPADYAECALRSDLLDALPGRITPHFSWSRVSDFEKHGMGFCLLHAGKPAAWAFSAAVSASEIDIGVETAPEYRHLGLGAAAAGMMVQYTLEQHKQPVWACDVNNTGSRRIAEKLGFAPVSQCVTIRRDP